MTTDEHTTLLCAIRYAIHRRSYAPRVVRDYARSRASDMSQYQREGVVRVIRESCTAVYGDILFDNRKEWLDLADEVENRDYTLEE